jgi:predicted enzyme related to lactoylglutathione lyase
VAFINRLHMAIIMAHNFEETVAFYHKLGLDKVFHLTDKWAEFALGEIKIGICPTSHVQEMTHTGLVLEIDDIASFFEDLQDLGAAFHAPKDAPHGIMASMKDPSGNIIDLYQPTPERLKEFVARQAAQEPDDSALVS